MSMTNGCRTAMTILALAPAGIAALKAAEPVRTWTFDERLFGFSLLPEGRIEATFQDRRAVYGDAVEPKGTQPLTDAFRTLVVSADRKRLIHNRRCREIVLDVWDLKQGRLLGSSPEVGTASDQVTFLDEAGSEAMMRLADGTFHRVAIPSFEMQEAYVGPQEDKLWFHGFHRLGDGRLAALYAKNTNYVGEPGGALLWDVWGGRELLSVPLEHSSRVLGLSADGAWLIATTQHRDGEQTVEQTRLIDISGERETWDFGPRRDEPPLVSFHPRGTQVALFRADGRVTVYDVATRAAVWEERVCRSRMIREGAVFDPEQPRLYVGYNEDTQRNGPWDWVGRVSVYELPPGRGDKASGVGSGG